MARLKNITVSVLGNIAPGTRLDFDDEGVVLLGRNGTGKTTLLNTVVAACQRDFESLGGPPCDIAYTLACSNGTLLQVTMRSNLDPRSIATDGVDDLAALLRSTTLRVDETDVEITLPSQRRMGIRIVRDNMEVTFSNGDKQTAEVPPKAGWIPLLILGYIAPEPDREPLKEAAIELFRLSHAVRRFDEGLEYFRDLTDREAQITGTKQEAEYIVDPFETKLVPLPLAKQLINTVGLQPQQEFAFLTSQDVGYLSTFADLIGFDSAWMTADADTRAEEEGKEHLKLSPLRFYVSRGRNFLNHKYLSFGQKRLLSFLHYLQCNDSVVVADELVNGMHYEWIRTCLSTLASRQSFLSSQNPLLFDFLTFNSEDHVARRFITCSTNAEHQFVWTNMPRSDAREFFETYKVGLQHVSEILRTRGYW